jgi:hypothetical protein
MNGVGVIIDTRHSTSSRVRDWHSTLDHRVFIVHRTRHRQFDGKLVIELELDIVLVLDILRHTGHEYGDTSLHNNITIISLSYCQLLSLCAFRVGFTIMV